MKNACHKKELAALRRIEGQVRGIERMIDNGDYCVDILNQIKAAKNSMATVEGNVLKTHLEACVRESLSGNEFQNKVDESVKILKR